MPSIADVYLNLRVKSDQVRQDAEAGLKRVDTSKAGASAGESFGKEFSKTSGDEIDKGLADAGSRNGGGSKAGQKFGGDFAKGIGFKGPAIALAITGALAVGPAGIAVAGAALGVGFAAAAGVAIYKSLSSQLKDASKNLATAQKGQQSLVTAQNQVLAKQAALATAENTLAAARKSGNATAITAAQAQVNLRKAQLLQAQQLVTQDKAAGKQSVATAQAQVDALKKQLAQYNDVKGALTGLRATLIEVGNKALVGSGILGQFALALKTISTWVTAHQKMFTDFFAAAAPYVSDFTKFFLNLVSILLPQLTKLMTTARPAVQAVLNAFLGFVKTGLGPFLQVVGQNAGISAKAFGAVLGQVAPLLPLIGGLAGIAAHLIVVFPQLTYVILGIVAGFKLMLLMNAVSTGLKTLAGTESLATAASLSLRVAMLALPWVALAAALITLTVVIIKYHKVIWETITGVWGKIYADVIKPVINWFTQSLPHAFDVSLAAIKRTMGTWGPILATLLLGPVAGAVVFVVTHWNTIKNDTVAIWSAIWGWLKSAVSTIVNFFATSWRVISGGVVAAWNAIKAFFIGWWTGVKAFFVSSVNQIGGFLAGAWRSIAGVAGGIWNGLRHFFDSWWSGLTSGIKTALSTIGGVMAGAWNTIKNTAGSIWGGILNVIKVTWAGIQSVVAKPINAVIGFIDNFLIGGVDLILSTIGIKGHGPHGGPIPNIPKIPGFASGGRITQGTHSTADDVIIRASRDETVLSAAHSRFLAPLLGAVGVPGYASGGKVGNPGFPDDTGTRNRLGWPELLRALPGFAAGGKVTGAQAERTMLDFMLSKRGHPYSEALNLRLGPQYFDCSGLVFRAAQAAGIPLPQSQSTADTEANFFSGYDSDYTFTNKSDVQPGDIVYMTGAGPRPTRWGGIGHVGMATARDTMISALGTAFGVTESSINNFVVGTRLGGAGGSNVLTDIGHAVQAAAGFAVNSIEDLLTLAIPAPLRSAIQGLLGANVPKSGGVGWAGQIAEGVPKYALGKILPWVKGKAFDALKTVFASLISAAGVGSGGSGPAGGATGSEMANGIELYQYLLKNLFGGNKIAAAGATASIWGESTWNPFAQGTGGRGLIGWTPPGTISNADFSGGMKTQLPAILRFVTSSGDSGVIAQMFRAGSVFQAANEWGRGVERFGINDVHSQGVALATQIMNSHASGGTIYHPTYGIDSTGTTHSFAENGPERIVAGGSDPMLAVLKRIEAKLDAAPARTAAGVARAVKAPQGQEAQAARIGAR